MENSNLNIADYAEYRCPHDGKLLFKGIIIDGEIEIKCKGCRELVKFQGDPNHTLICKKIGCVNRV